MVFIHQSSGGSRRREVNNIDIQGNYGQWDKRTQEKTYPVQGVRFLLETFSLVENTPYKNHKHSVK